MNFILSKSMSYFFIKFSVYFLKKKKSLHFGVPVCAVETNLTSTQEDADSIPSLTQCVKDPMLP